MTAINRYEEPTIDVVELENPDAIVTSTGPGDTDEGNPFSNALGE